MTVALSLDHGWKLPELQGHTVGFVDTQEDCEAVVQELKNAGVVDSTIQIFGGEESANLLEQLISGSLWGEADEEMLKQGLIELSHGHFVLIVEAQQRDQAMTIAYLSAKHGGHSFTHFGLLADTRLTR